MRTLRSANKVYLLVIASIFIFLSLAVYVSAATVPANAPPGSSLKQRVAQRKKERAVKLDDNTRARIESQCTFAQSKLRGMSDGYTSTSENRDKVYRSIDAKLWIIIGNLKLISKDTFKLEQQRLEYLRRVQAFESQSAQFQQSVKDLAAMNCASDPIGFKAMLETARLYNAQIRSSFIGIKSYLIDQVQPTVSQQSNDLKLKTSTE